jgi:uncharacterized damage-inducible protein DinB
MMKCAGLTGEQLALMTVGESNLSLLGLIRHLAKVERIWFRILFRGEQIERLYSTPEHKDADFEILDPATAEEAYATLIAEQDLAREITASAKLDDTFDSGGEPASLRFILIHMVGEYARHNGHADLIRQHVDGVTGA